MVPSPVLTMPPFKPVSIKDTWSVFSRMIAMVMLMMMALGTYHTLLSFGLINPQPKFELFSMQQHDSKVCH